MERGESLTIHISSTIKTEYILMMSLVNVRIKLRNVNEMMMCQRGSGRKGRGVSGI